MRGSDEQTSHMFSYVVPGSVSVKITRCARFGG
jgi:hypothetical protein